MIDFGGLFGVLKLQLGTAYMLSVRGWTAVKRDLEICPQSNVAAVQMCSANTMLSMHTDPEWMPASNKAPQND